MVGELELTQPYTAGVPELLLTKPSQVLIKLDDFIIRQFPYLIEETVYRDVFVKIKDFKILNYEKDELNPEKFKEKISFFLPKGSYATMVIKQMF